MTYQLSAGPLHFDKSKAACGVSRIGIHHISCCCPHTIVKIVKGSTADDPSHVLACEQILSTVVLFVRVSKLWPVTALSPETNGPFPYIANHILGPIWTVSLRRKLSSSCDFANTFRSTIAVILLELISPRKYPPISSTCGFFPFCFGRHADFFFRTNYPLNLTLDR